MSVFNLYAKVVTPVGTFFGKMNGVLSSKEDLISFRDAFQLDIHNQFNVTLFNTDEFGNEIEITLPQSVMNNSVFIFTIAAPEVKEEDVEE